MTEAPSFVTVERQGVVALVIEQIRGLIASGALQPGQCLPGERDLSKLFGVSRPSVREAIRALGFMGILEIRQGSGTCVASTNSESIGHALSSLVRVSREALTDLMEVRIWLEVGAVELAAKWISDEQLASRGDPEESSRVGQRRAALRRGRPRIPPRYPRGVG